MSKDILTLAREAGFMKTVQGGAEVSMASMDCLERFADLVRAEAIADENEACAQVCEQLYKDVCADAIRERLANARARMKK